MKPPVRRQPNVLELIDIAESCCSDDPKDNYPIFLRRNSWGEKTVFCVGGTYPDWKEWYLLKPPYYNGQPGHKKVAVFGVVHWAQHSRYEAHWLSCPGTYAYTRIERPDWWNPPDVYAELRSSAAENPFDLNASIVFSLRQGTDDDE